MTGGALNVDVVTIKQQDKHTRDLISGHSELPWLSRTSVSPPDQFSPHKPLTGGGPFGYSAFTRSRIIRHLSTRTGSWMSSVGVAELNFLAWSAWLSLAAEYLVIYFIKINNAHNLTYSEPEEGLGWFAGKAESPDQTWVGRLYHIVTPLTLILWGPFYWVHELGHRGWLPRKGGWRWSDHCRVDSECRWLRLLL